MSSQHLRWMCRERTLDFESGPLLMGILNVTPDSFSDGGLYDDTGFAVERGLAMIAEGADILDVGGESTRPGAASVDTETERRRVEPVIRALCRQATVPVSVDTMKADVAQAALDAGAAIINDVSAMTADAGMMRVARGSGAGVILMHMRGLPRTMQQSPAYGDVVGDVAGYLAARIDAAGAEGIDPERLCVDPGIGFGKTLDHNVALLRNTRRFRTLGRPVVIGLSRKSMLGSLTGRDVTERLAASLAGLAYVALEGAHIVHDVAESKDALRVIAALNASG
jgi:dihydropteroate synthase